MIQHHETWSTFHLSWSTNKILLTIFNPVYPDIIFWRKSIHFDFRDKIHSKSSLDANQNIKISESWINQKLLTETIHGSISPFDTISHSSRPSLTSRVNSSFSCFVFLFGIESSPGYFVSSEHFITINAYYQMWPKRFERFYRCTEMMIRRWGVPFDDRLYILLLFNQHIHQLYRCIWSIDILSGIRVEQMVTNNGRQKVRGDFRIIIQKTSSSATIIIIISSCIVIRRCMKICSSRLPDDHQDELDQVSILNRFFIFWLK